MSGSELLIGAAAKGLAALVTDTTQITSDGALRKVIQSVSSKSKQAIFQASRSYIENYQKRHCQMKVLGMREPVDLASVYTGVKLLSGHDILKFELESLESTFRQSRLCGYTSSQSKDQKYSGIDIANTERYLMVLGGPGAGKSTFLKKVGLEALRTFYFENALYKPRLIPVMIELKRFESENVDIVEYIANEFKTCGFPEAEAFAQSALFQGNLLVLLDGLDEVPSANLNNVLRILQDFLDHYDNAQYKRHSKDKELTDKDNNLRGNRFIASCRVAASGYRTAAFTRFSNVTMADFDDEQIKQFINNWFSNLTFPVIFLRGKPARF